MVMLAFAVTPRKRREDRERTVEIRDRVDGWIAEGVLGRHIPLRRLRRGVESGARRLHRGAFRWSSLGARFTGCSSECCRPSGSRRAARGRGGPRGRRACGPARAAAAAPRRARGRRARRSPAARPEAHLRCRRPARVRGTPAGPASVSAAPSSPRRRSPGAGRAASRAPGSASVCAGSAWRLWSWNGSRSRS